MSSQSSRTVNPRAPVLLVAPEPFYEDRGTPIAVRQVLTALSQLGYKVDLLTYPVGESPSITGVRYLRVRNPLGIRTVPIGLSLRKLWLDAFLSAALLRRLRRHSYLCVHAVEEAAYLAVAAARRYRVPVVYDMQSSLAEQLARTPLFCNSLGRAFLNRCERWLIRNSDWVITSVGLEQRAKMSAPDVQVRSWRFPSSLEPVTPDDAARLRALLDIPPDRPVVLYTGNFEEYQGLPLLLSAAPHVLAAMPEVLFLLVGADGIKETKAVERLARTIPGDAIRVLERQPRTRMRDYLAVASVVVSPRSYGSNLPLKVFDYLAAGCAIVATSIPAHRTVLNEKSAVLADARPEALAAAITAVLSDGPRAASLRRSALAYAGRNVSWLAFVRFVGELYKEVSAKRG